MNLLFLSTSVGALGSGLGGGVELTLRNIAQALMQRGHQIHVVAPIGSVLETVLKTVSIAQIPGALQTTAQTQGRDAPITLPADSVLANMWDYARQVHQDYDLLMNFAYDWLPFYLTPFLNCPIAHLVSMGSLSLAMDQVIETVSIAFPDSIGVHSQAQAATFAFSDRCRVLGNGLDLSLYQFCSQPEATLAWVGRIAPEKGLEDAIAAAQITAIPLKIFGAMQDRDYWQKLCQTYPDAPITYAGFLSTHELQQALRTCQGLLMTPRWIEAFGNVAIEALACGVPVIAYRRGGPAEIVRPGKTGWLVEPDSVEGLVAAIARLPEIDRHHCRQQAESEYSLVAMGDRIESWFQDLLQLQHSH
jgi:UDP-glucose:tetrahydrobiopterin glucosyltransferase